MKKPTKLRILVDIDSAAQSQKSGIGYYSQSLLKAIADYDSNNVEVIGHYFNFLGKNSPSLPTSKNIKYKQSKLVPRKLFNALRRIGINIPIELLARTKADFIVFPNFFNKISLFRTPSCVSVHDLTYLDHPELVSTKNRKDLVKFVPSSLKSAKFALTLSNTMANRLKEAYPWFEKPIVPNLIPVDIPDQINPDQAHDELIELGITKQFILFIGNIEPRKNILGLLEAYSLLPVETKEKFTLVLAGGKGWNDKDITEAITASKEAGEDIIVTGYVNDDQRKALYSQAHVVTLVSLYEGYGIPALEAMAYKKPVLLSSIPVLKEIAGGAAIFCDPNDSKDISVNLEISISDNSKRQSLILEGSKLVESRTWGSFAVILLDQIHKITDQGNRQ